MLAAIEVSAAALRANVAAIRAAVGPGRRVMSVVKADAYGHGLALVAGALRGEVDAFGVYHAAEALELAALGVDRPVHLLGPVAPEDLEPLVRVDAVFALWDRGAWRADLAAAARRAGRPARVALKVDTGLSRLGVAPEAAGALLREAAATPELAVVGAFSHLAAAEELASDFTLEQLRRFEAAVPAGSVPERHVAASAAALLWPQTRLDMVRVGIAQYGVWPSEATRRRLERDVRLTPALRWTTRLIATREVAAGDAVGYGLTYRPRRATRVGVLPIGYAEGLPRALSNRGRVLVEGARCPLVGRVCMNMAFVDLGAAPGARVGSTVTLIGADGDARARAEDLARDARTIGYEIVARLPREIPRRLVDDGDAAQVIVS